MKYWYMKLKKKNLGIKFRTLVASLFWSMLNGNGVPRAGRGYENVDHIDKKFLFHSILLAISRWLSISSANAGLMMFFKI